MEQPANKYHRGQIYTIRSHQTDKFYIGSTTNELRKRLYQHCVSYKAYKNGTSHNVSSFDILQYEDHYIELLEEFKCENKKQLEKREGELIRLHKNNCINVYTPQQTREEYRQYNKEKLLINDKEHYKNNVDKILIRKKKFYEDNTDKLLNKAKQYYKDNVNIISNKKKQKYKCECGTELTITHKKRHELCDKHIKYIATQI